MPAREWSAAKAQFYVVFGDQFGVTLVNRFRPTKVLTGFIGLRLVQIIAPLTKPP
jgi:hypothetical protein